MQTDQKTINRVVLASVIGATIEWYDFFLYGVLAGIVLNKLYFPPGDPTVSTLLAYATFAVGFLTRPIGAVIFGHFGDRVGRKSMLVITLTIMGVSTFMIGCVPTYAQIGLWAPAALLFLRVLQGIGLGGEWGGAVLMAYEYAPAAKKGFYTSLPQLGLSFGVLLSAGSVALLSSVMTEESFLSWGWRIGFLVSFALVLVGALDPPSHIRNAGVLGGQKHASSRRHAHRRPIQALSGKRRTGARRPSHRRGVLQHLQRLLDQLLDAERAHHPDERLDRRHGWCDRLVDLHSHRRQPFGPVPTAPYLYAGAAILSAVSVFPAFWLMSHSEGSWLMIVLAIVVPYGLFYSAVYGNVAGLLCDLFDANVRYTGISFVYQMTSVVAGLTPLIATLLVKANGGDPWLVCWYTRRVRRAVDGVCLGDRATGQAGRSVIRRLDGPRRCAIRSHPVSRGSDLESTASPPTVPRRTAPADHSVPAQAILDAFHRCGIRYVTTVPDMLQIALHQLLDRPESGIRSINCATEDQAVETAAGLWAGGAHAAILVQNQGFYAAINSLRALGLDSCIPLFFVIGQFGREFSNLGGDARLSGRRMVRMLEPLLETLEVPYWRLEGPDDLPNIERACVASRERGGPTALIVGHFIGF